VGSEAGFGAVREGVEFLLRLLADAGHVTGDTVTQRVYAGVQLAALRL
jgi:hypothetical protein